MKTVEDVIKDHPAAWENFKSKGCFHLLSELDMMFYEDLYEVLMHEMPYGVAKARTGDPIDWIENYLNGEHIDE